MKKPPRSNRSPRVVLPSAPVTRPSTLSFTLIELLVVMAIIGLLLALVAPAFTSRNEGYEMTIATQKVQAAIQTARAFAIANNTFAWVGFFEEDIGAATSLRPRPAGTGRLVIAVTASRQGNRYKDSTVDATDPHAFYAPTANPTPVPGNDTNPVILTQVGKLEKIDNFHFAVLSAQSLPRPTVPASYQVGADDFSLHPPTLGTTSVLNPTSFNYPLSAVPPNIEYTFTKIIEFNPRGEAVKIVDFPAPLIEIGLQGTHGSTIPQNVKNPVAIQLSGSTGQAKIYRK